MADCSYILIWVALISGGVALIGALGTQWFSLRSKKLEVVYKHKSEAYNQLFDVLGAFALEPKNIDKYLTYLSAYEKALLFASNDIKSALTDRTGLNVSAQRLRAAEDNDELLGVQVNEWKDAVDRVAKAMHSDLAAYS